MDLLKTMEIEPCKSDYEQIWYCREDGSRINFTFKNDYVCSVLHMWEFNSKNEAEIDVESEIAKTTKIYGRPERKE